MEAVLRKSLKYTTNMPVSVTPMDEINGFSVRPGMFDSNGAMALPVGVNFTVHTHHGTSCTLLLFHRGRMSLMRRSPFRNPTK